MHGVVDARDVHHRDAPGAEVQVPDLAVAHLSRRQPDVGAARADERVRVLREERVKRGVFARRTALSALSARSPKPSRIMRTSGRGARGGFSCGVRELSKIAPVNWAMVAGMAWVEALLKREKSFRACA